MSYWLGITTTVTAVAAIFIAVYEAHQARIHNRLSVRPLLNLELIRSRGQDRIGLKLGNFGLGPAIIISWDVKWNGNKIDANHDWTQALQQNSIPSDGILWQTMGPQGIIQVGESFWLFSVPVDPENMDVRHKLDRLLGSVSFEIKFKSVYEEELPPIKGPFKTTT